MEDKSRGLAGRLTRNSILCRLVVKPDSIWFFSLRGAVHIGRSCGLTNSCAAPVGNAGRAAATARPGEKAEKHQTDSGRWSEHDVRERLPGRSAAPVDKYS